jgi:hypothetical protein
MVVDGSVKARVKKKGLMMRNQAFDLMRQKRKRIPSDSMKPTCLCLCGSPLSVRWRGVGADRWIWGECHQCGHVARLANNHGNRKLADATAKSEAKNAGS